MDKLSIMMIDDSQDDVELLVRELRRGLPPFEWHRVDRKEEMQAFLRQTPPDLILCDYHLPGFSAVEALKILHDTEIDIPFILVSGKIPEEEALESMRHGCHDYVIKDNPARLTPVIYRELEEARMRRDRQHKSAMLRQSEERFRFAVSGANDIIWDVDLMSRDIFISERCEEILGYSQNEIREILANWQNIVHPDDMVRMIELTDSRRAADIEMIYYELRVKDKAGQFHWILVRGKKFCDASGTAVRIAGSVTLIDAVKQTETLLRESEARVRSLLNNTEDIIFSLTPEWRVVVANRSFFKAYSLMESDVIGRNLFELNLQEDMLYHLKEMLHRVAVDQQTVSEEQILRVRGDVRIMDVVCSAQRGLEGQVLGVTITCHDITEIKKSEQKIKFLAYYDKLTELPNRTLLTERLEMALKKAIRQETRVGLIQLDVHHLKRINDVMGHTAGDAILRETAARIRSVLPESAAVARTGSDEFVLMLTESVSYDMLRLCVERIHRAFDSEMDINGVNVQASFAVGMAIFPDDADNTEDFLKAADTAMSYAQRNSGRGIIQFTRQMHADARKRLEIEAGLREGLRKQEFLLHYQPQVALSNGGLTGFEALVRWQHGGNLIPPDEFIPVSEESGLIIPMGVWILREAVRRSQELMEQGYRFEICVNMSALQLMQRDIVQQVQKVLEETNFQPEMLELEITESMLIESFASTQEILSHLKHLGVRIALDDFGVGYSSLTYLRSLPVDTLKIDRSFINDIGTEKDIVGNIINIAHKLGMKVVAEGVETPHQLETLRWYGCDKVQGYFLSKPVPENLMAERICQKYF